MNKLLLIPLFALLLISVSFVPADALKAQGNSNSRTGADICGDRLCESGEQMTPQEKLGYYLMSLLEFEIEDDPVMQQGITYTTTLRQSPTFDSSVSWGKFSSQSVPMISAKTLSSPTFDTLKKSPMNDYSPISKKFNLSARSISSLIDKTQILSEKIDFSKVTVKKLQPIGSIDVGKIGETFSVNKSITDLPGITVKSYDTSISNKKPGSESTPSTNVSGDSIASDYDVKLFSLSAAGKKYLDCNVARLGWGNGYGFQFTANYGCQLRDIIFSSYFTDVDDSVTRRHADLGGADLSNAYIGYSNLQKANLVNANLQGATFDRSKFLDADFRGANLRGVSLIGGYLWLADFRGANLQGADFDANRQIANFGVTRQEGDSMWDNLNIKDVNFSGANLTGANLRSVDLSGADFTNSILYGTYLSGANLTGANLSGANFTKCIGQPVGTPSFGNLPKCVSKYTPFVIDEDEDKKVDTITAGEKHVLDCNAIRLSFGKSFQSSFPSGCDLRDIIFVGGLTGGNWYDYVDFSGADLSKADFHSSKFERGNFNDANLYRAVFTSAHLFNVDFIGADLQGADFRDVLGLKSTDFRGANLQGADFRNDHEIIDVNFSGANLSGADFSGVNLSGVDLKNNKLNHFAVFNGANLIGADFSGANLIGADFSGANLSGANLSGAKVGAADFTGANISSMNINGAFFNADWFGNADFTNCVGQPIGRPFGAFPTCKLGEVGITSALPDFTP